MDECELRIKKEPTYILDEDLQNTTNVSKDEIADMPDTVTVSEIRNAWLGDTCEPCEHQQLSKFARHLPECR